MKASLESFFSAWGSSDPVTRREALESAMAERFSYEDPNSNGPITDMDALADYVGQFLAALPGGRAVVEDTRQTEDGTRASVGFGRAGETVMRGTYEARFDDEGRIAELRGAPGAAT